jgi:oxygen-independent coproporphyrinogen-3 oxidase
MSSLYLHIPFCRSRCFYCDFYSQVGSAEQLSDYVELLRTDLRLLALHPQGSTKFKTIFFGGGTPSLLSAEQIAVLLRQIEQDFGCADDCEISLEANPGTLDAKKLQGYRAAGVNRLSLGVQTFSAARLQQLGRSHSVHEANQSVALARAAGFENLNLDLIFSLPGQTDQELQADLESLLELQPQHLSLYGLSFEPETELTARLQRGELVESCDEVYAGQYRLLHQWLTAVGFEHYEISNFALPGYRCRHNQVYWRRQTCLAVGSGAHSFLASGWGERWQRPELAPYRSKLLAGENPGELLEHFDRHGAMKETIYLALRTADGLPRKCFQQCFGVFPEVAFPQAFTKLKNHLQLIDDHWRFNLDAWLLYDHLISAFL